MKTSELEYFLPPERIAQRSVKPRDHSKLFVYDRVSGRARHLKFFNIVDLLRRGDLLVFNNTKVFRARMFGKTEAGGDVEILLLRPQEKNVWLCLGKPGKRLAVGARINFIKTVCGVVAARHENGEFEMQFLMQGKKMTPAQIIRFANAHGEIPLPPYVKHGPTTLPEYQTVYARAVGSVAAPTAGFHFTRRLRAELRRIGVKFAEVTLHVGIGTFQPVKTEEVAAHPMHSEWVSIDASAARAIAAAKKTGRRVIAVGTTTTRALEGAAETIRAGRAFQGDVNIFITPGYNFKIIDALVTNFHLPRSTLLLLVSAFIEERGVAGGGVSSLKNLYKIAIDKKYRFFSFGDAMFIV